MPDTDAISRRGFARALAALPAACLLRAQNADHGRVTPPVRVPDLPLKREDGSSTSLLAAVQHHVTAVQTIFTECTTTCPMQGAIFAQTQKLLSDQQARGIQLLSLSIDPVNDNPKALESWLRKFNARPGWIAAAPRRSDLERLIAFFGPATSPLDTHSTQVHLINRDGMLIWRTFELPAAEEIAAILQKM